jgi:ABC-type dipeptide/oligopeptide/nickel transport system permease component
VSLPTFLIGILLILVFAVLLKWLPSFGRGDTVNSGRMDHRPADRRRLEAPGPAGGHAVASSSWR